MNVLSLFDGMSCGQLALDRANIWYDEYFACEIDKYAITVTQANYPLTHQLGDVTKVKGSELPKIDLLIGGSPCQGFSFAGKQLNFEDPRSKLFFEFVRLLEETKPKYFLLENVKMKKEYQDVISKYLGVEPILINSASVSAQNRRRLYWTNIEGVEQPEDKGILLKDILETEGEGVLKDHGVFKEKTDKSNRIDANYFKGVDNHGQRTQIKDNLLIYSDYRKYTLKMDHMEYGLFAGDKRIDLLKELYVFKAGLCCKIENDTPSNISRQVDRVYGSIGKSPTCNAFANPIHVGIDDNFCNIRKLTPIEWERIQTVPDNYTNHVSNTQRYKMLGNGWTVDVIAHILRYMKL